MYVSIDKAIILLEKGYVVGIKTDTVYGLAVRSEYVLKLYNLKNRPINKKIVSVIGDEGYPHVSDSRLLKLLVTNWPGATTFVYSENGIFNSYRMTSNYNVNYLINRCDFEVKLTSANYSGKAPVESDEQFFNEFPKVALVKEQKKESKSNAPSKILLYNRGSTFRLR